MATTTPRSLSWATQIQILFAHTCVAPPHSAFTYDSCIYIHTHEHETVDILRIAATLSSTPSPVLVARPRRPRIDCSLFTFERTMLSLSPRPSFTFRRLPSVFQDWLRVTRRRKPSLFQNSISRAFTGFRAIRPSLQICMKKKTRAVRAKLKIRLNCIKFITQHERLCYSTLLKYDKNQKIVTRQLSFTPW